MATIRVKIVGQALNGFVEKLMISLSLQVLANLTASPARGGTPVDTGWARANWVPSITTPAKGTVGSRDAVSRSGQSTGKASLISYRLTSGPIHITNNVPYIGRLNDGSSKQAPRAFVQAGIARAIQKVAGGGK